MTSASGFGVESVFYRSMNVVARLQKLCFRHTVHTANVMRYRDWGYCYGGGGREEREG